jgi:hypothetical protein
MMRRSCQNSSNGGSWNTEAVADDGGLERFALLVVVAEHAVHGHAAGGEHLQGLRLGDVAGVDHPLDAGIVEQLDDAGDVAHVVVGVADDADAHGTEAASAAPEGAPEFGGRAYAFSRMWMPQALPRPMTWVMPMRAPST